MGSVQRRKVMPAVVATALSVVAIVSACGGEGSSVTQSGGSPAAAGSTGTAGKGAGGGPSGAGSGADSAGVNSAGTGNGGANSAGANSAGANSAGANSAGAHAGGSGGGGAGTACRTEGDCASQSSTPGLLYCAVPGSPAASCGNCPGGGATDCRADTDCRTGGGTMICERYCGGACPTGHCVAGCTAATACAVGTACGASGRCEPTACQARADCPTNFDCLNSVCVRAACTSDSNCSGNCVLGACYSTLGVCTARAA